MKGPKPQDTITRFESKFIRCDGCWNWQGTMHKNGYPLFDIKTNGHWHKVWAHRFAYNLYKAPLQPCDTVDHLCFNPRCVNPSHLDAVPSGENSRRSPRTLVGMNVRKTHCPQGHSYAEFGYLDNGHRKCRICVRARNRKADARRRALRKVNNPQ